MVAEDDKAIYFRFGTELVDGWDKVFDRIYEHAKKTQDKIDRARFKMPPVDTGEAEQSHAASMARMAKSQKESLGDQERAFREHVRKMIETDEEIAAAQEQANKEKWESQLKWGAALAKQLDKDLAAQKKAEAEFAKDSQKLAESLAKARAEWLAQQETQAQRTIERSSKAIEAGNKKLEDSLLKVGRSTLDVARGLTYLGAVAEDDAEKILKVIVRFEAFHAVAKGGIGIVRNLTEVWQRYMQVRAAAAAIEGVAGAAGAARTAGSLAGAAGGAAAGAGGAAKSVGGLLSGAVGAVGGAAGVATLGGAAVAITGIVGTLYYFDKNFKAGVDKFLFGMTDAEQKILKRIDVGERETSELRTRMTQDRQDELTVQDVTDTQIRLRARASVLGDKSIPAEERGLRADVAENADLIADRRAKLQAAVNAANAEAANARDNPNSPQALAGAEISAKKVVDLNRELRQLEQDRLGLAEKVQQVAVDALSKQRDAARETADLARQTADEYQRIADEEAGKYRSDLERFGAANPIEQEKVKRIKEILDRGGELNAEQRSLGLNYNEFRDRVAAQNREQALRRGGGMIFEGGEDRVAESQAAATAASAAAQNAQSVVAKLDTEVRVLMEANVDDLARQLAEGLVPYQEQLVAEVLRQIELRRQADAQSRNDRQTKQAITAGGA